ncbi:hypothetical protein [Pseudodesulfovibrio portus]|uniref:Uncharacterized protein n=1 Tax=Pseudodesulfovibrio portus TaxID=231439 RepID=A0ABN6RWB8_9BACT|nr:hypothetical protein [Pseudodesulfovibrio portus]BDQ34385.1 hypothetical protein JCM14722_19270 [Pseudodesulfovibrio portus]
MKQLLFAVILVFALSFQQALASSQYKADEFSLILPDGWSEMTPDALNEMTQNVSGEGIPWQMGFSTTPDQPYELPLVVIQRIVTKDIDKGGLAGMAAESVRAMAGQYGEFSHVFDEASGTLRFELPISDGFTLFGYTAYYVRNGFIQVLGYNKAGCESSHEQVRAIADSLVINPELAVPESLSAVSGVLNSFTGVGPIVFFSFVIASLMGSLAVFIVKKRTGTK